MSFFEKHCLKLAVATATGALVTKYFIYKSYKFKPTHKYIVIDSIEEWDKYEDEILSTFEKSEIIGIDCEWVTVDNRRNPVSLLQLANSDGFCLLVRLTRIPVWLLPDGLTEILRDKNTLKVGVGVSEDAGKLFHDYCLEVQGLVDLRYLANDLDELKGKSLGLKSLAKELLGYDLNKSHSLRCSNWDAEHLTESQVRYAADDAIISAKLYKYIKQKRSGWFNSSNFDEMVDVYMDVPFKQYLGNNNIGSNGVAKAKSLISFKRNKTRYSKPRSRPMYDNCQLVAPDGELLCSCDRGKAQWYVYKELGEIIKEDPFTVRLNFEPSGRPTLDNVFYTKEKSNCCVVCGKTENYHRKLVVPSEYRKYFPNLMKKNLSHDVLLLCVTCHKRSNILDHDMRLKLADMCDAPLMNQRNAKYKHNPELARVKSAAKALHCSRDKIPEVRRKELSKIITNFFNVSELTDEILEDALVVDTTVFNESFVPHGLKVYQYFCKNGGLIEFERMWRQHFLDTMQPKYLPTMWSVEHNHQRLTLQVINQEREIDFDASILGLSSELLKEIEECDKVQ